jgi:serine/threonine-protein kinase
MGLASALSFNLRQDEAIVSRTIPMIPPDKREEWIIRQARQRPTAERGVFLDGACAGDAALRERLERLLAAHDQPEEVLADGIDAATVKATIKLDLADAPDETVGQTLGRYKLLERVGEQGARCGHD